MSFLWVLMIKFIMASDLKISFSSGSSWVSFWNAGVLRYAPPIKFFKRKKEKKESQSSKWKVSEKQVFLKKYYPIRDWCSQCLVGSGFCFETVWVEIFFKTRRAWTFFSEYLELIFALFFFIFCFEYPNQMFLFSRI